MAAGDSTSCSAGMTHERQAREASADIFGFHTANTPKTSYPMQASSQGGVGAGGCHASLGHDSALHSKTVTPSSASSYPLPSTLPFGCGEALWCDELMDPTR
jgi:hypothetical protein